MNPEFNFSAFSGVKSGQKTLTSTPILSAKGHINKFTLNKPALDLLGVDKSSNIYFLCNPSAPLKNRYSVITLPASDELNVYPGAKIVTKEEEGNFSATFQYSPVWGHMQGNTLETKSPQEMKLSGVLVPFGKQFAATKAIDWVLKKEVENIDIAQLAQFTPELEGITGTTNIYSLSNPTEIPYEKRTIKRGTALELSDLEDDDLDNSME